MIFLIIIPQNPFMTSFFHTFGSGESEMVGVPREALVQRPLRPCRGTHEHRFGETSQQ